jgi:subtilisin family serine protease
MEKLSPALKILLAERLGDNLTDSDTLARQAIRNATLPDTSEAQLLAEPVTVHVWFQDSLDALESVGFVPKTQAGNIVIGEITIADLPSLASLPNVLSVDQPAPPELALDDSIPEIRANQVWSRSGSTFTGLTGNGVIVGIVDTGVDYLHKTFRNPDGTTRILRIWDQTLTPQGAETSPAGLIHPVLGVAALGYGVEYLNDAPEPASTIKRALGNANPRSIVRHQDTDGHGTHVASTAAGNGSQNGNCHGEYQYIGVAPKADLIVVRMRGLTKGDPARTGTELIDALRYIADRAGGLPCVINLSLGAALGPRDGSGNGEMAVDNILTAYNQGFAIVFSAGNAANDSAHAQATVPSGGNLDLKFTAPADNKDTLVLELYYSGTNLNAAIQPPGGTLTSVITAGNTTPFNAINNGGSVTVSNSTNLIRVNLNPPMAGSPPQPSGNNLAGEWTLKLSDTGATGTSFHAWSSAGVQFTTSVSTSSTTNSNSSADNVIVVGAYDLGGFLSSAGMADFSSRGPTLRYPAGDSRNIRPHLSAPGVAITAAAIEKEREGSCCCVCCKDFYKDLQGTSMAAPHVTGAVALILEKNPTLSFSTIRDTLRNTARTDVSGVSFPNNDWGSGKLNVKAATDAIAAPGAPAGPPTPIMMQEPVLAFNTEPTPLFSLRDRLRSTAEGDRYYRLFDYHFREVRDLINQNKRVAVTWHRHGGSALISLAMAAVNAPEVPLPLEVEGTTLYECLWAIASALRRYGGLDLQQDITATLPLLSLLQQGLSPLQILDALPHFYQITQRPIALMPPSLTV